MAGSSAPSLVGLPAEILLRMCSSCPSFKDVLALTTTCQQMHAIWEAHQSIIIWHVAPKSVVAFDNALMTVRATTLVHETIPRGILPPLIQLERLTGEVKKPNLQELHDVLALNKFVDCLAREYPYFQPTPQYRYFEWMNRDLPHHTGEQEENGSELTEGSTPRESDSKSDDAGYDSDSTTNDEDSSCNESTDHKASWEDEQTPKFKAWREQFDSAVYSSLLLGAVLARQHALPFNDGSTISVRLNRLGWWESGMEHANLGESEIRELIRHCASYNVLGSYTNQDRLYGSVADWFIRSAREAHEENSAGACSDFLAPLGHMYNPQNKRLFDLDPLANAWPWDSSLAANYTRGPAEEGDAVFAAVMQAMEMLEFIRQSVPIRGPVGIEKDAPLGKHTAKVVIFGRFDVEEIRISSCKYNRPQAFRVPGVVRLCSFGGVIEHLWRVLRQISRREAPLYADLPGMHPTDDDLESSPAIPIPPLGFFAYVLKKEIGLRLVLKPTGYFHKPRWEPIPQA